MGFDIIFVGDIVLDMVGNKKILGGSSFYAAYVSSRLGKKVCIYSCLPEEAKREIEFIKTFSTIVGKHCKSSIKFKNEYDKDGNRKQLVFGVGKDKRLSSDFLKQMKIKTKAVCICPVINELSVKDTCEILRYYKSSIKFLSLQGFGRREINNMVFPKKVIRGIGSLIKNADVVVFSDEDITDYERFVHRYMDSKIFVVTMGKKGALLFKDGERLHIPIYEKAKRVDPTGAGDTFLSALITRYIETYDIYESCLFASCAASVIIEDQWINRIRKCKNFRKVVEDRLGSLR